MGTKRAKVEEIKFNPDNSNRGTSRGDRSIKESIEKFGFRDAGILDKNGILVSGEHRTKAANDAGVDDAIVISIDEEDIGKALYLQFPDLDLADSDNIAHALGLWINRTAQLSINLKTTEISLLREKGIDLSGIFTDRELKLSVGEPDDLSASGEDSSWGIVISLDSEGDQLALLEELMKRGYECRSLVS
jgi:hypothetical protein